MSLAAEIRRELAGIFSGPVAVADVFFTARTVVQWRIYDAGDTELLAIVRVAMGWPTLVLLLIATYVLGRRWLKDLQGPSVAEWQAGSPPLWKIQPAGF